MGFQKAIRSVRSWNGPRMSGRVSRMVGMLIEATAFQASEGELCSIYDKKGQPTSAQVVGFKENRVLLMSLEEITSISIGAEVFPRDQVHYVPVGEHLRGRVLDALGGPIDEKGPIHPEAFYPVNALPPPPLKRQLISEILPTGIKSIDGLLTIGRGQRIGIFSCPGTGKSTLMGMLAKRAQADINVIALIGERGREVREFIERELGPEGLARSVVVVVTSDQSALLRAKGALVATAIAEFFRDQGKNVLLLMDSITRYAMACREMGLATGEPPTTRGYTPSVFAKLPRLLERAGNGNSGSITGIYTILTENDEWNDPLAEQARALLDGHFVLSPKLASSHLFPPIHILSSLSRVMVNIVNQRHFRLAGQIREWLHAYEEVEDYLQIGAYAAGSNPIVDAAIKKMGKIRSFLRQDEQEFCFFENTIQKMEEIIN